MDITRNKVKKNNKKLLISFLVAFGIVVSLFFLLNTNNANLIVSQDSVLTDKVQRGDFVVTVRGTGVLAPRNIRWIATDVEGRVEQIFIKAGARVKTGDVLMVLSNPQLQQQLEEAQWELEALEAEIKAQVVSLESQLLDQEAAVIFEKLNHERTSLTLDAQDKLLNQGIVAFSKIAHAETKIDANQFKQRWELEQKRLAKHQENLSAQKQAAQARLKRMQRGLQRLKTQVKNLNVKATMDSIVQEMPMELGQQVTVGTNLAKLARTDRYLAELRIPENLIKDVTLGQNVTIDTRISKIQGKVQRVDPAVVNSSVQVDVELIGALPNETRPDLTVDGVIEIAKVKDTFYIKRPMFAQSNRQSRIFIINPDEKVAHQKLVRFGRSSSRYIEIKQGAQAGDEIVISDTRVWANNNMVKLN
ncbi:RND transporter [Shewanella sp. OPT22]|nr:RND transporter [Shewanella sp. OPT22]